MNLQPPRIQSKPSGQHKSSFDAKPFVEETRKAASPSKKTTDSVDDTKASGWNVEDDWEGDGWGDMGDTNASAKEVVAVTSEATDKETKKAELMKKREERKQQREKAMRERKAKGGGALKLGGVKKVAKDTFD